MVTSGTRLGPYEILRPLGAGGMGRVYRARDTRLDRDVAVKVLHQPQENDPEATARFELEAKAVAALSHPNILAIHDFAVHDGLPFTVTELLDGQSLRELLAAGPLSWRQAAEIGVAVADGLSAAHAKGIVHRDLKPENLFVTADGRVKILDFGLALWSDRGAAHTPAGSLPTASPADSGIVVGTLGYMSPEQARGLPVHTTSDIFSFGCVLYELVTGRRPFERETPTDTLAAVLNEDPAALSASGRPVPPELARVICHCLEKNAAVRFQSARDLAFALRAVLADSGVGRAAGRPQTGRSRTRSLAVLPFVNEGADPDTEYLSDGITESIINSLATLPKLRVIPRATVFRFKGHELEPRTAAIELNADVLLTGRVVQRGDLLNISAELVDAANEAQLWGQRYTRRAADVLVLQDEIAGEICAALKLRLSGAQKKRLAKRATVDTEAYKDYLRGLYYWNKWTADGIAKAVECFEQAIHKDPAYALAHAGLAYAYSVAAFHAFLPNTDAMPRARAAAQRALEIDPDLAEAHTALGLCAMFFDWNWSEAERAFQRALQSNPKYSLGRLFFALYLAVRRRTDEALARAREAEHIDPLSVLIVSGVSWVLIFAHRLEDALAQAHRALELDPNFAEALELRVGVNEMLGRYGQAAEHLRDWLPRVGLPADVVDGVLDAYRARGPRGYWEARLDGLKRFDQFKCLGPMPFAYALVHAQLGNEDPMFEALEQCYRERLGPLPFINASPAFAAWRDHPRLVDLLRRIGLAG